MNEINQNNETLSDGMRITEQSAGFRPEEMAKCGRCDKPNPPTRTSCLYCGNEIQASTAASEMRLRRLEPWEKGFNIVVRPGTSGVSSETVEAVLPAFPAELDGIGPILSRSQILPLARVDSAESAVALSKIAGDKGVDVVVVGDDDLRPDVLPIRLRGVEFIGDHIRFIPFNTPETFMVSIDYIALLVAGSLYEAKTESSSRRKRGKSTVLEESEVSRDERVLDIYLNGDNIGYRVRSGGFDFSCLGEEKEILASNNIRRLAEKLLEAGKDTVLASEYSELQELLSLVWEPEERRDSSGLKRSGLGKLDLVSVRNVNNHLQFLKYSRLRKVLL